MYLYALMALIKPTMLIFTLTEMNGFVVCWRYEWTRKGFTLTEMNGFIISRRYHWTIHIKCSFPILNRLFFFFAGLIKAVLGHLTSSWKINGVYKKKMGSFQTHWGFTKGMPILTMGRVVITRKIYLRCKAGIVMDPSQFAAEKRPLACFPFY